MKTDKNSRTHSTTSGTLSHPDEQAVSDSNHAKVPLIKNVRMSYEKWLAKYCPITNHLDINAAFDGCMFETFGVEIEFVRAMPASRVWTLVECDGKSFICEGYHFVNRLGYFVTEVAAPQDRYFSIKAD
jgi:hypothetical protein